MMNVAAYVWGCIVRPVGLLVAYLLVARWLSPHGLDGLTVSFGAALGFGAAYADRPSPVDRAAIFSGGCWLLGMALGLLGG